MKLLSPKFHDVEQNTDEWLSLRAGKVTSSSLSKIMANEIGAFGEPAKKLAINLAVESMTGKPVDSGFSNGHTERGHAEEPIARMAYENEMFCAIQNGGFFDCGDAGCSPDGLTEDNGIIEIKCVVPSQHYANVKRQSIDPAYKWQVYGNLMLTDFDYIDFVSYCSNFPIGKKLFVCRVNHKDVKAVFQRIETRVYMFWELVESAKKGIQEGCYSI